MRQVFLLFFLLQLLFSCQKFEQNNPFDSKCPKDLWTPTSFTAVQNGTSVTLSWSQPMNNISGFKLTKKVDTGSSTDLQSQNKGIAQFTDPTLIGGKLHTYTIVAYAGNNLSNILTTTVTPKLVAGGVTTTAVSAITTTTLSTGGNITTDGGVTITARGVCWSTTTNPTIANSKTTDGTGTGSFTSSITGLTPGATYYIRAYATNSIGTTYGNELTTAAAANLPVLTTTTVSAVTTTTANSGGYISSDGGGAISARGVCWSTTANPTIANSKTNNSTGIGTFTSAITGLASATTYYVRAYATNSAGTAYGQQEICVSSYGTVSDMDGNTYQTIKIGTQIWTRENLKTTKFNDGTVIPMLNDNTAWTNQASPGYCWYNNDATTYKSIYGALYDSYAINTGKMCPIGWHVASDVEWDILIKYLGDNGFGYNGIGAAINKSIAAQTNWNPSSQAGSAGYNPSTNNSSGFSAFPGGIRQNDGVFSLIGEVSWWWCFTGINSTTPKSRYIQTNNLGIAYVTGNSTTKGGYSVRCISGELTLPTLTTTAATSIASTSATSGGNISSDGGTIVTARGVCWSTTPAPTIANSKTSDGTGLGSFTSAMTGLTANTTFYARAYATNAIGTSYGTQLSFTTLPTSLPSNGLIAWYPFNGNAKDESGNGNNGIVNGATLTSNRFGISNNAYSFSGTNYIDFGANLNLVPDNFSISGWFKTSSLGNDVNSIIRARWNGYSVQMLPDGKVYFTCAIVGETLSINSANSYNNNLWHNFIVTFGNSTSNLFVDGSLVGSKTGGSNKLSYALGAIAIGRDGDNNGWFFNGILDDIGIWNRALSQQEITDIFNSK